MSIFVDLQSVRVLHAVEGRAGNSIILSLKMFRRKAPNLKAIAMGMSTAFNSAVEQHLPDVPIVFDRYYVSALINKGIEDLHREQ